MNICGDTVDEILSRLPVKSLLRFRVVCKDCYYRIHSDYFIAKHLKNQKTNEIYHDLCDRLSEIEIKEDDEDDDSRTMFHADQQYYIEDTLGYLRNYEDSNEDVKNFLKLYNPCHQPYLAEVVGSCNGILCLDYYVLNDDEVEEEEDTLIERIITLWNPATRDFKVLPSCELQPLDLEEVIDNIGFGFDCTSNDYKVLLVRIHESGEIDKRINQAMIYSLNTNSWRELDHSNVREITVSGNGGNTISLRENVYWVKLSFNMLLNPVLLSFDMEKEVFQSTSLPLSVKFDSSTEFFTLHEYIALVLLGTSDKTLEIWTTKKLEQGRELWIKVFNIDNLSCVNRPFGIRKCKNSEDFLFLFHEYIDGKEGMKKMKGIYINNRGEIKNLYDGGEIKNLNMMTIKGNIIHPEIVTYVETLISVNRL